MVLLACSLGVAGWWNALETMFAVCWLGKCNTFSLLLYFDTYILIAASSVSHRDGMLNAQEHQAKRLDASTCSSCSSSPPAGGRRLAERNHPKNRSARTCTRLPHSCFHTGQSFTNTKSTDMKIKYHSPKSATQQTNE